MKWLASISIDGAIQAPEKAQVSVYDRGFLHRDSIFETVCTCAGEPFALAERLSRLEKSAELEPAANRLSIVATTIRDE